MEMLMDPKADQEYKELCFMEWVDTYHPDMDIETYDRESNKFFNNPDKYRYNPDNDSKQNDNEFYKVKNRAEHSLNPRDAYFSAIQDYKDAHIEHHGVLGQKWGIRRYQDYDGRLTSAGRDHYGASGTNGSKARASKAPQDILDDCVAANGGKGGIMRSYFRHNNCAFCSVAYEMRRRGENVRSQEALDGVSQEAINKAVKNLKSKEIKDYSVRTTDAGKTVGMSAKEYDSMVDDILKDGENSRGQMTVKWKALNEHLGNSGGHAINYEVKNGTFYLVDPQVGKVYSGKQAYKYLSNANNVKTFRTDNKQFDKTITEKYYTEKDTGRIDNTAKAAARSRGTATAAEILACVPVVNLVAVPALYIANTIQVNKADKERSEQAIELENKWQKEKRNKFYDYGKTKGKK